ncbi:hypothetical protein [Pedobacter sp. MW01-1-1]|uniref:hypothetical protein n=1 Tax=Pedobacter sp. MW01-1-1 TaxID=3383027 RepID=UPI003FF09F2C
MEHWKENLDLENMDPDFLSIRSMFISGSLKNMYQLVKHSPTKISKLLGLNYDAYHTKLLNPEKFSLLHINILAFALHINPNIINTLIQKQIEPKVIEKIDKFKKSSLKK